MKLENCFLSMISPEKDIIQATSLGLFETGGLAEWLIRSQLRQEGFKFDTEKIRGLKGYFFQNKEEGPLIIFADDLTKPQKVALMLHLKAHLDYNNSNHIKAIYEERERTGGIKDKMIEYYYDKLAINSIEKFLNSYKNNLNYVIEKDMLASLEEFSRPPKLYQLLLDHLLPS